MIRQELITGLADMIDATSMTQVEKTVLVYTIMWKVGLGLDYVPGMLRAAVDIPSAVARIADACDDRSSFDEHRLPAYAGTVNPAHAGDIVRDFILRTTVIPANDRTEPQPEVVYMQEDEPDVVDVSPADAARAPSPSEVFTSVNSLPSDPSFHVNTPHFTALDTRTALTGRNTNIVNEWITEVPSRSDAAELLRYATQDTHAFQRIVREAYGIDTTNRREDE